MGPQKLINKQTKMVLGGLKFEKMCTKVQFSREVKKKKQMDFLNFSFSNGFDAVMEPNICKHSSVYIALIFHV